MMETTDALNNGLRNLKVYTSPPLIILVLVKIQIILAKYN